jgi:hypothetical protein
MAVGRASRELLATLEWGLFAGSDFSALECGLLPTRGSRQLSFGFTRIGYGRIPWMKLAGGSAGTQKI